MIFQNQSVDVPHPADSLGVALTRATGVLSALTSCHDAQRGGFAVGDQFVLQAIAAIEGFVSDARNAYMDLCDKCDLRMMVISPDVPDHSSGVAPPAASPTPTFGSNVLPPLPADAQITPPKGEHYAPSYEDLLRKLTAAEVFASEQDGRGRSDGSSALLPLLRSLRSDLERIRAA